MVTPTATILHLVHRYTVGGAEAVVNYLCRFSPPHINNIVCSFYEPDSGGLQQSDSTVEILCLHKRVGNDVKAVQRLAAIIRDKKVDIVHAQGWATYIEGLAAAKLFSRKKCKFVYAFHGKTIADVQNGIPPRRRIAQKVAAGFTDVIIAPSRQMAADYAATSRLPANKVQVLYNGIDLSCYGRHYPEARRQMNIHPDDFVIGFVGRIDQVKNLPGLFQAFYLAREKMSRISTAQRLCLLLVGDGLEMANLKELAAQLKIKEQVSFLGMRGDIAFCLSAMDVYAQPSFYEGHSNTILEAMAAGLPVISTDVGGTPEIITHNQSGLLFQPDDYEGMSQAILQLLEDETKRNALAKAGKQTVQERFSVETMVKAYVDLFEKLSIDKF